MATITPDIVPFNGVSLGASMRGGGLKVTWSTLTENDTATAWSGGVMYPNKSVQAEGTFGTVVIEGSNNSGSNYETLTDEQGGDVSFVADGIRKIEENTELIRPSVSSGTGVSVNVTIIASRGKD